MIVSFHQTDTYLFRSNLACLNSRWSQWKNLRSREFPGKISSLTKEALVHCRGSKRKNHKHRNWEMGWSEAGLLALGSYLGRLLLYLQAVRTENIKFLQGRYLIKEPIPVVIMKVYAAKKQCLLLCREVSN